MYLPLDTDNSLSTTTTTTTTYNNDNIICIKVMHLPLNIHIPMYPYPSMFVLSMNVLYSSVALNRNFLFIRHSTSMDYFFY